MGVNESKVYNETPEPVFIVVYNNHDNLYWAPCDARQVPVGGQDAVKVEGAAGGLAVKVGVLYNRYFQGKRFVCDLFRVPHESALVIEKLSQESGVESFRGDGVELLAKGKVISLPKDATEQATTVVNKQQNAMFMSP